MQWFILVNHYITITSDAKTGTYMTPKGTSWWRFSGYEVRNGFICPAPEATLRTYDPWASYWKEGTTVHTPPYVELAEVIRQIPADERLPTADEEPEALVKAILAWCRKFGLLGLLPHSVSVASLDPYIVRRFPTGWEKSYEPWNLEDEPKQFTIGQEEFGGPPWLGDVNSSWWKFFPEVASDDPQESATLRREFQMDSRSVPLSDELCW